MRSWLYKKDQEPQLFHDDELKDAYKDGWVDSPAKIFEDEVDVDPESSEQLEPAKLRGRPKKVY